MVEVVPPILTAEQIDALREHWRKFSNMDTTNVFTSHEALRAENLRLRETLTACADGLERCIRGESYPPREFVNALDSARAVLAGETP